MKMPDKEMWPPECLGLWMAKKSAYQKTPCLTELPETKVLCKLRCPRARAWSCVDASRKKREKNEKGLLHFSAET
jgi:hypothetical protein